MYLTYVITIDIIHPSSRESFLTKDKGYKMTTKDKLDYMLDNSKDIYDRYDELKFNLNIGILKIETDFNDHETVLRLILNDLPFRPCDADLFLLEYIIQVNKDNRFKC